MNGDNTDFTWLRSELREVRNRLDELMTNYHRLEGRILVVEIQNKNAQVRNTQLPGWIIGIIGLLISAVSVAGALWGSGRIP